jgi:hypothetical protein
MASALMRLPQRRAPQTWLDLPDVQPWRDAHVSRLASKRLDEFRLSPLACERKARTAEAPLLTSTHHAVREQAARTSCPGHSPRSPIWHLGARFLLTPGYVTNREQATPLGARTNWNQHSHTRPPTGPEQYRQDRGGAETRLWHK